MSKFSALFLKRLVPLGVAASAAAVLLAAPAAANATPYVINLVQQGTNVVATGNGAIDLLGLSQLPDGGVITGLNGVAPSVADISLGSVYLPGVAYGGAITGPTNFGSGGNSLNVTTGSGDYVEMFGSTGSYGCCGYTGPLIGFQSGYVSGTAISNSMTIDNATFASLGVTPGTYVWTWGTGADQSFTLEISNTANVPEPAALGMFGFGVLLIGAFVGLRRRVV